MQRTAALTLVLWLGMATGAQALKIEGSITDASGAPIPWVRVTVAGAATVPATTTVFTTADGRFATPDLKVTLEQVNITSFRIGWQEETRTVSEQGDTVNLELTMATLANVADQVPGSAWIPGQPGDRAHHILINECAGCHQLGAERVKRFAKNLIDQPLGARVAAWDAMVQYMRATALRMGPSGHTELRWALTEASPEYVAATTPGSSFFLPRDMDIVVPYLAEHFTSDFSTMTDYDDVARLGAYGVTKDTVIEEYQLPTFGWTREVAIAPGSDKLWFLELDADRLGSMDTESGAIEWFDVPGKDQAPQGPHTLNADADGNLWMALEESFSMARFSPLTHEWRVYPPPAGVKFAITHDAAINSQRHVQTADQGRLWLTLVGLNELWSVDVKSGAIERFSMPLPEGEEPFHVFIYGAAMDPNRKRVWFTQLHGYLGAFNTETEAVERIVPFPRGAAPRRMAIEDDGTLWVPLYGEGQLVKFDTNKGAEVARYDMPDRAGATYSVTLDPKRHAVWIGTTNSDRIYRFDIDDERWRHYPLPRKEAFLRMIEIDHATGDIWTTYANLPVGPRDPAVHGIAGSNNMLVRLVPGD
jgi:streptogramin lyase